MKIRESIEQMLNAVKTDNSVSTRFKNALGKKTPVACKECGKDLSGEYAGVYYADSDTDKRVPLCVCCKSDADYQDLVAYTDSQRE